MSEEALEQAKGRPHRGLAWAAGGLGLDAEGPKGVWSPRISAQRRTLSIAGIWEGKSALWDG